MSTLRCTIILCIKTQEKNTTNSTVTECYLTQNIYFIFIERALLDLFKHRLLLFITFGHTLKGKCKRNSVFSCFFPASLPSFFPSSLFLLFSLIDHIPRRRGERKKETGQGRMENNFKSVFVPSSTERSVSWGILRELPESTALQNPLSRSEKEGKLQAPIS